MGTSITLTWDAVSLARGYEIEENDAFSCGRGQEGGTDGGAQPRCDGWYTIRTATSPGATSYTVTGLTPGLTYDYRIRSYRGPPGSRDYSAYAYTEATIAPAPTATPVLTAPVLTAPVLTARGFDYRVELTWTRVNAATEYRIQEERIRCGSSRDNQQRDCIFWWYPLDAVSGLSYSVTGLDGNRTHKHRVCSYRSSDESIACSNEENTLVGPTPTPGPTSPPPPTLTPVQTGGCADDPFDLAALDDPSGEYLNLAGRRITYPEFANARHTWVSDCRSSEHDQVYALFFEFSLNEEWHLTIDLHALAAQDTLLRVKKGNTLLQEDNDGYPDSATGTDSRIARRFEPGSYTIEATMTEALTAGTFKLKIDGEEFIPALGYRDGHTGHQRDYTVQYEIGTPAPPPAPPGQASIIDSALGYGVNAWNAALARSSLNVRICKEGFCPAGRNAANGDGRTVLVNVVHGKDATQEERCYSVACVKNRHRGLELLPDSDDWNLLIMTLVIEEPAYLRDGNETVWTLFHHLDGRPIPKNGAIATYRYLPSVFMHEFGHTLGLEDLDQLEKPYDDTSAYVDYLMYKTYGFDVIPDSDVAYAKQVYRNEHGSEPH